MTLPWARLAFGAARDRIATGRPIDEAWVTRLECDAILTAHQGGRDVFAALSGVRMGLSSAAGVCPACGMAARISDHGTVCDNPGCTDPWSPSDGIPYVPRPRHAA